MERTIADGFKDMTQVLLHLREELALQDPQYQHLIPAARLHPFSTVNIEEQRNLFQSALSGVVQRLEQARRFCAEPSTSQTADPDAPFRRLVSALRERSLEQAKVNNLQSTLQTCQHMAMKYLEKRATALPAHAPLQPDLSVVSLPVLKTHELRQEQANGTHKRNVLSLLRVIKDRTPGIEGIYIDEPEVPTDNTSVTFSAPSFLVDVYTTNVGNVVSVTCDVNGARDNFFTHNMSEALLSANFTEFETLLRKLAQRSSRTDALRVRFPNLNVNEILSSLEQDLVRIVAHEQSKMGVVKALQQQHGLIQNYAEGASIFFYVHPIDLAGIDEADKASLDKFQQHLDPETKFGTYCARLSLEWGPIAAGQLPQSSSIQALLDSPTADGSYVAWNQNVVPALETGGTLPPVNFFLTLNKPLALHIDLLKYILKLVYGDSKVKSQEVLSSLQSEVAGAEYTKLLAVLYGGPTNAIQSTQYLHEAIVPSIDDNATPAQCYFVPRGPQPHSLLVKRLPFIHLRQLLPILQILRQQIVANELFRSCLFSRLRMILHKEPGSAEAGRKRKRNSSDLNGSSSHLPKPESPDRSIMHVEIRCLPSALTSWQLTFAVPTGGASASFAGAFLTAVPRSAASDSVSSAKKIKTGQNSSTVAGGSSSEAKPPFLVVEVESTLGGQVKVSSHSPGVDSAAINRLIAASHDIPLSLRQHLA